MKCLWIARDIPFPLDAGDKIYSANMARSLDDSGTHVRFLGHGSPVVCPPGDWPVDTLAVNGAKHTALRALISPLPLAAAMYATPAYRVLLEAQLRQQWDVVVIDSYGAGWALDACVRARTRGTGKKPVLVYLSHNHEESLWRDMACNSESAPPKKFALWQNYRKVRALERRLVDAVDLIAAISTDDAEVYARTHPGKPIVVLTPGYSGWIAPERKISADSPYRVVLVGSFRWIVKQENLRRFLTLADAPFTQKGIRFDVIGDVPQALLNELRPRVRATAFHGFVDDIAPFFSAARMAIVPELIGGGFKLKFLDYIFGRVPVASVSAAAAGLPETIRANVLCRQDLQQLVDAIVEFIGQPRQLNAMQQHAFTEAQALFQWRDRGVQFRHALEALQ